MEDFFDRRSSVPYLYKLNYLQENATHLEVILASVAFSRHISEAICPHFIRRKRTPVLISGSAFGTRIKIIRL